MAVKLLLSLSVTFFVIFLEGCQLLGVQEQKKSESTQSSSTEDEKKIVFPSSIENNPIPLKHRLLWSHTNQAKTKILPHEPELLYTFSAKGLPIDKTLELFAKANALNIVIDKDVVGEVNVNFNNLNFQQAMSAILDSFGYYWTRQDNLVFVKSRETRSFKIDYIRLIRSGSGSSQAQVSSGGAESSSETGGEVAGTIIIGQEDKVDFWTEVETQLTALISEDGRLVVNRLSGTIQVTDQHRRVEEIAHYIDDINHSIYRQVDIEVKIVEVTLNNDESLGINWDIVFNPGSFGDSNIFDFDGVISQSSGGVSVLPPAINFTHNNTNSSGDSFTGVVSALKQQGDVNIVSQPRIRTLNNQAALIKVGTDRTFFRKEQVTDSTTSGSQILSSDVPQVVTEGIVLSLTPQISQEGWITLDVSPVVTRVSSVSEVVGDNGNVLSTAPNLDISQTSSLVRAKSGETVIIGGLIQTQETETKKTVPGLHLIPVLGSLFKGTYQSQVKRELIMFVTPRLVDSSDELFLSNQERDSETPYHKNHSQSGAL